MTRSEAADWFRDLRRQAGLTQKELAEQLGITVSTVMNMESPAAGWPHGKTLMSFLEAMDALKTHPTPQADSEATDQELLEQAVKVLQALRRRQR